MSSALNRSVCGLVLAAGGSSRLGQPKQLLPYGDATLLDHVLGNARACGFDQLIVTLGGAAVEVRARVDLSGVRVVENESYGDGCSSSIATALPLVDPRCDVIVLMLGDQPGVGPTTVRTLLARRHGGPIAVCRYDDGIGHPFAFTREVFGELAELQGDKGVWKLIEQRRGEVVEVRQAGPVPPDVDTWEDYEALVP
ncbi:MAG: molybdenum cofactor cytidylyltransferase [Thermoleophilaceae bacterium]|jgi:molybdenum cofactor cytidylyltransferase|nr:molybdenum cofactor cytidylyltransferase [Thermoleophilaceae bacterium]